MFIEVLLFMFKYAILLLEVTFVELIIIIINLLVLLIFFSPLIMLIIIFKERKTQKRIIEEEREIIKQTAAELRTRKILDLLDGCDSVSEAKEKIRALF